MFDCNYKRSLCKSIFGEAWIIICNVTVLLKMDQYVANLSRILGQHTQLLNQVTYSVATYEFTNSCLGKVNNGIVIARVLRYRCSFLHFPFYRCASIIQSVNELTMTLGAITYGALQCSFLMFRTSNQIHTRGMIPILYFVSF